MIIESLASVDWQAIGTWFTGIALAVFAYLTWRLSKRQQQLMYSAELEAYARYDPPRTGYGVFVKKDDNTELVYDGIAWEVGFLNPGSLPIIVKNVAVSINSVETGKSAQIWPGGACSVFNRASGMKDMQEPAPGFTATAGKAFVRSIVIHDSRFRELLQDVTGPSGRFALEVKFTWEAAGREAEPVITSQEITLSEDVPFGSRVVLV